MILIPTGIYLYVFFRRIFLLVLKGREKLTKILAAVAALAAVRLAWPAYGLGSVIVLHLVAISLIITLLHLILRHYVIKDEKTTWETIYNSGILSFLVLAIIFSYGYYNMHQIKEKEYTIASEKVEDNMRIALLSDVHLGTTMDAKELETWCDEIEKKKPDVVLLAGDIFDEGTLKGQMQQAAAALGNIKSTYGTYYVYGNHDYNNYREVPEYYPTELTKTLEAAEIKVLEDEAELVDDKFYIIGRQDATVPDRQTIHQLIEPLDADKFLVLVDHQPGQLEENADAGIDLQVSGHTHAGQIWPTGQLMELLGVNDINYGYRKTNQMQTIVSSGMAGWGYPIRTGGHCEYVLIDVEAE